MTDGTELVRDGVVRRIAILGSCVTRDVFRVALGPFEVVSYHCRTSLVSLMSPPLELEETNLVWPSAFSRRMVAADFAKTFFRSLSEACPDLLLVDLVEERHKLLRRADSYVAYSRDLTDAGFEPSGYEIIDRFRPEIEALWYPAATRFGAVLRARLPQLPVVIHRAFGLTQYRTRGSTCSFPPDRLEVVGKTNRMLARFYTYLEAALPGAYGLELPTTFAADSEHRWGLAPYHYEDAYYVEAMRRLEALMPQIESVAAKAVTSESPRGRFPN